MQARFVCSAVHKGVAQETKLTSMINTLVHGVPFTVTTGPLSEVWSNQIVLPRSSVPSSPATLQVEEGLEVEARQWVGEKTPSSRQMTGADKVESSYMQ